MLCTGQVGQRNSETYKRPRGCCHEPFVSSVFSSGYFPLGAVGFVKMQNLFEPGPISEEDLRYDYYRRVLDELISHAVI